MSAKPTIKNWLLVTRPWSFSVSALPAIVALIYSIYSNANALSNLYLGLLAVVGAVVFHAGGNLLSDYNDYNKGVDQIGKQGGTDQLTSGLFKPKQILAYGLSFILIGVILGLFLVYVSGVELLWIGIAGTIGAVFYSFFKFRALGDLLIFLVYGPIIMLGTGYVMLHQIYWPLFFVAFPMAFITVNVLHSNNTRDQRGDKSAKIKTFAMQIGTKASKYYYYLLTVLAYLSVIVMVILDILPYPTLIVFLTIPIAYNNCKAMKEATEEDISPISDLDLKTAKLQTAFSILMSLGLLISFVI